MSLDITVTGDREVIDALNELRESVQRRLIERAGRASLKPVVKDMRAHAPRDTGKLAKSIGVKKAKRVPNGEIVLSVGARKGFAWTDEHGKRHDPFFYAIPNEYGHKTPGGGFVPPVGFARGTFERNRESVIVNFGSILSDLIDAEMAKS